MWLVNSGTVLENSNSLMQKYKFSLKMKKIKKILNFSNFLDCNQLIFSGMNLKNTQINFFIF